MTALTLPGIDPLALEQYLRRTVPGAGTDGAFDAHLLAGGRSNVSYRIRQGSRDLVLRRPPLGNVLPSAHDMTREYRVLSGLGRVDFPAPEAVALCDDTEVIGAPFMLMEFVSGPVIATADDAAALSSSDADTISRSLVETLARLHTLDVEAAGLAELGRPTGYLKRQVARWSDQWERTKTRELPEMNDLRGWLAGALASVPEGLPWSLVHGDYRIDNAILDPGSLEVAAVLDWEMSTLGDPVSDLAITLVYWNESRDRLRHDIAVSEKVTEGPGFWSRARLVDEYAKATGFDLGHLDFCLALSCFKLAVIMESIHKRTLAGLQLGASAEAGGSMGSAAPALAGLGLEVVAGGGVAALGR